MYGVLEHREDRAITVRPFEASDRSEVFRLLDFLPTLYPRGFQWLDRRLDDVLDRKARCLLVGGSRRIAGIIIETPKASGTVKLSTIYVHQDFRGQGIGKALLVNTCDHWRAESVRNCYVTADYRVAKDLGSLLAQFSFEETAFLRNRYGDGRHEVVFSWFCR